MVVGLRPDAAAAVCDNRLQNQRGYSCCCYESVFFIFERPPRQREAVEEEDHLLSFCFCNAPPRWRLLLRGRNDDCTTGDGGLFVLVVSEVAPIHPRH